MVRCTRIEPPVKNPVLVGKDSIVNELSKGDSKVRAKFMARKNFVKSIKPSSRSRFLTCGARLAFVELR